MLEWLVARQSKAVEKYGVKDPRIAAFIILDDVIADQKTIRWSADLQRFFVQGRHLAITVFIASQYLKGVGPMVRGNCDYIFLQPVSQSKMHLLALPQTHCFRRRQNFSRLSFSLASLQVKWSISTHEGSWHK